MELLNQYLALTTDDERSAFLAGLDAAQLDQLRGEARARFDELGAIDVPTADELNEMGTLAEALTEITGEDQRRLDADEAARARRDALLAQVNALEGDDGGEGGEGDGSDAGADAGAGEGGEADAAGDAGADAGADAPTGEPVGAGVQAGGTPPRLPSVRATARRAPTPRVPPMPERQTAALVASADVPGFAMGQPLTASADIAEAFIRRFDAIRRGARTGDKVIVASANARIDQWGDRYLSSDPMENTRRIRQVFEAFMSGDEQGITAAGGLCAPLQTSYDLPVLGRTDRPIRDQAMVRFGADRGGISWIPAPRLADVSGTDAVSLWTNENDATPSNPTTKPCATFSCPSPTEELVDAIVRCLQFGNFLDRTFRELIDAYLQLVGVWHSRYAEQRLITLIDGGSTNVSSGQGLGATSDFLAAMGRFVAARRNFERLPDSVRYTAILPQWLPELVREDLARQMPNGSTDERYAAADAAFERWMGVRGIDPVWSPDLQVLGAQVAGTINGWPSTVRALVYARGTWDFLDGGTLDLGVVRDSTLNSTNDFQMFAETFEGAARVGPESWDMTLDLCPNGTASALTDFDPCTTGS